MKRMIILVLMSISATQCTDFVDIDPPRTSLVKSTVFSSDATANAAMADIYYQLQSSSFASGGSTSVTFLTTLLSDEQENFSNDGTVGSQEFQQFNDNNLLANNSLVMILWSDLYSVIYKCNAVLEGVNASATLSAEMKKQLEGEARFIRAFCYFYLVNLWGAVPQVSTTDYETNSSIERTPSDNIYIRIKEDLLKSIEMLPSDFTRYGDERIRATTWTAYALLSRVHVYTKSWAEAIDAATTVINNTDLFHLVIMDDAFRTNNEEALLQWWSPSRPSERDTFRFFEIPDFGAIRKSFALSFQPGDQRAATWIDTTEYGYYRAVKYYEPDFDPPVQYSTVIRLSELYLIRAECYAQLSNLDLSLQDINVIRTRAGLDELPASGKEGLLAEVMQQRKSELFTEWGHRWFDLKRTGLSTTVLSPIKSEWKESALLMPVPEQEIKSNPALLPQNPGY